MNLYKYSDYLLYLRDSITQHQSERGYHAKISKEAGMHPSYLSRILHGNIHLTPEQASGLCEFWRFDGNETRYFMGLVNLARAGTPKLKRIINEDLEILKAKHEDLSGRIPAEKINTTTENIYYSAWYYGAVHMLMTIPGFTGEFEIAQKLNLGLADTARILQTLEELNLVKKTKNGWAVTKENIHLNNQSWMAAIHHINWRTKITDKIQFRRTEDLHYSGLHTLSRADFKKIKNMLLDCLVQVDETIRPSKEEELGCLLIDWSRF